MKNFVDMLQLEVLPMDPANPMEPEIIQAGRMSARYLVSRARWGISGEVMPDVAEGGPLSMLSDCIAALRISMSRNVKALQAPGRAI